MEELPFKAPGALCNARLARQAGYCDLQAGWDTDHPGTGRCSLHGGAGASEGGTDGPRDLWKAAGLQAIIDMAETMTSSDQEYLYHVSNNALTVTRAGIVARMQAPDASPKELADLSMALARIDKILERYPEELNPEMRERTVETTPDVDEFARLEQLERERAAR